jgi:hypothetical protein
MGQALLWSGCEGKRNWEADHDHREREALYQDRDTGSGGYGRHCNRVDTWVTLNEGLKLSEPHPAMRLVILHLRGCSENYKTAPAQKAPESQELLQA